MKSSVNFKKFFLGLILFLGGSILASIFISPWFLIISALGFFLMIYCKRKDKEEVED